MERVIANDLRELAELIEQTGDMGESKQVARLVVKTEYALNRVKSILRNRGFDSGTENIRG